MAGIPSFRSVPEYVTALGDAGRWGPPVARVLERHGLAGEGREPRGGFNPTYPTFLCGDVVVKLFGFLPAWREAHAAERAAYGLLARDPAIAAPRLVADGRLADGDAGWAYLVTSRVAGAAWPEAGAARPGRLAIARALGGQVRRIHALPPTDDVPRVDGARLDVAGAAGRSSLPAHLAAQADAFLARLGPPDEVFVHGDLCAMHAFVRDGRLSGIIDWGDAAVADRHYELIQVHRDLFDCDKELLRAFLDASDWPVRDDFARRALGFALCRQATGLLQHHTMDVFEPVARKFPLGDIATLDELADTLFSL